MALVMCAIGRSETHTGIGRIDRQSTAIATNSLFADARFEGKFAHRGERTEAKLWFACGLIGHIAIEVLRGELSRFLPVAFGECLANIFQHMSRLLVLVPIVLRTFGRVGTTAPEGLFVERVALRLDASHYVAANAAVAQGE